MTTTPKTIRVGPITLQLVDGVRSQRPEQYQSEAAVLNEAARRGALLLAVESWRDAPGQYGGYAAKELARLLRHELGPVFTLLMEQGELPSLFQARPGLATTTHGGHDQQHPHAAPITLVVDHAGRESAKLGGDDEDWDA